MEATKIRRLVLATLHELGHADARALDTQLLFRDRCPVGICFDFDGISAIWLMAVGEIRFIDAAGKLVKVVRVLDEAEKADVQAA